MTTGTLNKVSKIHAYFDNIRIFEWRAFMGMAIFGYFIGTKIQSLLNNLFLFYQFVITISLYLAFSFAINNCYDIEGDKLGEMISKNPVASGKLSKSEGILQSFIIAFLGIFLSFYWFDRFSAIIYCLMTFLSWGYSAPPLRMKSTPLIDVLSHGLFFGSLLVLYGINISGTIRVHDYYLLGSIFVFSLILQLRNHIEDFKEDSAAGVQTTVTKLGINYSKKILLSLYLTHVLIVTAFLNLVNGWSVTFFLIGIIVSIIFVRFRKEDYFNYLKYGDLFTAVAYIIFVFSVLLN